MLHFISIMPSDWRFLFMGSDSSVSHMNRSAAIREQVATAKLDFTYIPDNVALVSSEDTSQFLSNPWLYKALRPAEWLLVFQTDSILCANSPRSVDDYLGYDWVGSPWHTDGTFGGNGGLSLRRVSAILDVLRHSVRANDTEAEDVWLAERLNQRPGAKMANGTLSLTFSGEQYAGNPKRVTKGESDDWRDGFYEPMGYHTGSGGTMLHAALWGTLELRKHIWDYCPEVKMVLAMDDARYVPGNCHSNWKRDLDGTEAEDVEEYAPLPPNLVPW
ncbi:hypothetical protein F4677DRAFT_106237 [Hypoxylon crocopeplum]|nr:hypothetical protein F4677DRAFT_106237 [Hypoxylon crocopeplum]